MSAEAEGEKEKAAHAEAKRQLQAYRSLLDVEPSSAEHGRPVPFLFASPKPLSVTMNIEMPMSSPQNSSARQMIDSHSAASTLDVAA